MFGSSKLTISLFVDQALESPDFPPQFRKKSLRALYKTCGRHSVLPRSLQLPFCYDRQGFALHSGGFADVWKGEHCGREVAVKVIRAPSYKDLEKIVGVGHLLCYISVSMR